MKCKHCGTDFNGNYCPKCGRKAENQNNFSVSSPAGGGNTGSKTILLAILVAVLIVVLIVLLVVILLTGKSFKSVPSTGQSVSGELTEREIAEESASAASVEHVEESKPTVNNLMRESGLSGNRDTEDEVQCSSAVFGNENYDRRDIKSIEMIDTLEGTPADAWDVSEEKNGSVMAWVDSNRLTIAANGEIQANEDCAGLFAWYSDAGEIKLNGNLNTRNTTDMSMMFYHCDNLGSIDLTGVETGQVTTMERMFGHCEALARLDLAEFNTARVTDMSRMFYHCKSLVSLDVSGFNTKKVTQMERIFESCESIPKLDVSSFDTSKVKSGKSMFFRCYAVKTIELNRSRFDTSKMTTMYGMFGACYSLKSVDVSGFKTGKVTDMSYMFNGDAELRDLDISSFDMSKVKKKKKMIAGTKLEEKQKEEAKKKEEEKEKEKKKNKFTGTYYNGDNWLKITKSGSDYHVKLFLRNWCKLSFVGYTEDGDLWLNGDDENNDYIGAVVSVDGKHAWFEVIESESYLFDEADEFEFDAD